jgi:hypothetical protein
VLTSGRGGGVIGNVRSLLRVLLRDDHDYNLHVCRGTGLTEERSDDTFGEMLSNKRTVKKIFRVDDGVYHAMRNHEGLVNAGGCQCDVT